MNLIKKVIPFFLMSASFLSNAQDAYSLRINDCITPSEPLTSNKAICSGQTAALIANGVGTLAWYSEPVGGTRLGGGNNFTTPVLTSDAVYYVQDSTCVASKRVAVNVTVNPTPSVVPISSTYICSGDATEKKVLVSDVVGSVFTYNASASSAQLSGFSSVNRDPWVTEIPSEIITNTGITQESVVYHIEAESPKGCLGTTYYRVFVDAPAVATVSNVNLVSCLDPQTLPGNTPPAAQLVRWDKISGQGIIQDETKFNSIVSLNPGENGTFAMKVTSGVCKATSVPVTITRSNNEIPTVSLAVDKTLVCEGTQVTFTAIPNGGSLETRTFEFFDANANIVLQEPSLSNSFTVSASDNLNVGVRMVSNSECLAPFATNTPVSVSVAVQVDKKPDMPVFSQPSSSSILTCLSSFEFVLNPITTGTITWNSERPVSFSSTSGIRTTVSGLGIGLSTGVSATSKNGVCPSRIAVVSVKRLTNPSNVNAGLDQVVCFNDMVQTFNLSGNYPNGSNSESSAWSILSGSVESFSSSNVTGAIVGIINPGKYIFAYTVFNNVCPSKKDSVTLEILPKGNSICGGANDLPANATLLTSNTISSAVTTDYIKGRNSQSTCLTTASNDNVIDAYYAFVANDVTTSFVVNIDNAAWLSTMELIDTITFNSISSQCVSTDLTGQTQRTYTFTGLNVGQKYELRLELGSTSPLGHERLAAMGNGFSVKLTNTTGVFDEMIFNKNNKQIFGIYNIQGQEVSKMHSGLVIYKYTDGTTEKVIQE